MLAGLSCQKTQLLGEYYLGDLIYENPYQGYETLVFKTSDDITLKFSGEGRQSHIHESRPSVNSNDYFIWEDNYTKFTDLDDQYDLTITMGLTMQTPAGMGVRWHDYVSDTGGYLGAAAYYRLPLNKQNLQSGSIFYDSLFILGTMYYNVYVDSMTQYREFQKPIDTSYIMPTVLFYNTTQGILKIDFNDSSSWKLKEIHW